MSRSRQPYLGLSHSSENYGAHAGGSSSGDRHDQPLHSGSLFRASLEPSTRRSLEPQIAPGGECAVAKGPLVEMSPNFTGNVRDELRRPRAGPVLPERRWRKPSAVALLLNSFHENLGNEGRSWAFGSR